MTVTGRVDAPQRSYAKPAGTTTVEVVRPVIEVAGLHKEYGATIAVDDVSFAVGEREIFGILGPNGAGKTTTVECLSGLRVPDGGTVTFLAWIHSATATRSGRWWVCSCRRA